MSQYNSIDIEALVELSKLLRVVSSCETSGRIRSFEKIFNDTDLNEKYRKKLEKECARKGIKPFGSLGKIRRNAVIFRKIIDKYLVDVMSTTVTDEYLKLYEKYKRKMDKDIYGDEEDPNDWIVEEDDDNDDFSELDGVD